MILPLDHFPLVYDLLGLDGTLNFIIGQISASCPPYSTTSSGVRVSPSHSCLCLIIYDHFCNIVCDIPTPTFDDFHPFLQPSTITSTLSLNLSGI